MFFLSTFTSLQTERTYALVHIFFVPRTQRRRMRTIRMLPYVHIMHGACMIQGGEKRINTVEETVAEKGPFRGRPPPRDEERDQAGK